MSLTFSGIESKHSEPFDSKYHVDNLISATEADVDYNTPNMVIFVKNEKSFYYLKDDSIGNNISHWQKLGGDGSTSLFSPYESNKIYTVGETASIGVNMFINISSASSGESPITNPEKWLQLGATSKYTISYSEQTDIEITHAIPNATICVFDTDTGEELRVKKTRVSQTQFKIESNQPTSGLIIIS